MKNIGQFFLVLVFVAAVSIISSITTTYTQKQVDKKDPFYFENEYELLLFTQEQPETIQGTEEGMKLIGLNLGRDFIECIIGKNISQLKDLSKSANENVIHPKTIAELESELDKYNPKLVNIQTKSMSLCQ